MKNISWIKVIDYLIVLLLLTMATSAIAAPKLTAEGAKKYFGDVNAPTEINTRFGKKKLLPLQMAAGTSDEMGLNMIQALIEAGALLNKLGPDGDAALHTASWRNTPGNIRLLVKLGADVNLRNKEGESALLKAINYRRFDAIKVLLDVGVDPNLANNKGQTAMHLAADLGDTNLAIKILKLLLKHGGNLEAKDKIGYTPLLKIVSLPGERTIPMVKFLLDAGANLNASIPFSGSILHEIAGGNHTDRLAELLDVLVKGGANIDDQNNMYAQTPLHKAVFKACYHGELVITKALLAYGADASLKDKEGNSARKLGKCNKQVSQLFSAASTQKKSGADKNSGKDLKKVIIAYVNQVDKAGQAYQAAKEKAAKARGFSGLKTRRDVQARQKLFGEFKDKSTAIIYLFKESKSLVWKTVQENKVEATQQEVEDAVVRKFGNRITEDGLKSLKTQFYWADAYFNVFTMLDQNWGKWSVDEKSRTLHASDKVLQAKLNKEMQAIDTLETFMNEQGK